MKKYDWKDIVKRAAWTFLEAFLAVLTVAIPVVGSWSSVLWSAIIGGISSAFSAIKTSLVQSVSSVATDSHDSAGTVVNTPAEAITSTVVEAVKPNGRKIYLSPSGQNGNVYAYPYNSTNEGEQCPKIAEACRLALESHGFLCVNAAGKDYGVRYAEARDWKPDLYLPIHTNAFNGKWIINDDGEREYKSGTAAGTRMFVRSFGDTKSYNVCKAIFPRLDESIPGLSSNIKERTDLEELNVMHDYQITACYAECDFHDNVEIAKYIIEHTEEIGQAIANGICDAFGVAW